MRVARAALLGLVFTAAACNLGPLGGTHLRGEAVREPVADWSFLADRYALEIETQAPAFLPSAHVWFAVHEGTLWLYGMAPPPLELPWVGRLREVDPGVRIRVDGKLYQGRATLVSDPAVLEPLLPSVLRKYHTIETSRARFVPTPERHPGTQLEQWFFRVDPTPAEPSA